ncbi:nuclear pore complex protein Nup107-like [Rhipicephalus microplus]|uniref:nuclear pore complex protein Nup107-like n=1 Tax=Rhipicephalus microplus TaxID=6941 RepID=UPI003F6C646E
MADFAAPGASRPLRGPGNVSANFEAADVTAFNAPLMLVTEHPTAVATAGIYADFMEAYNAHTSSEDVVTLVEKYASLCDSYLAEVMKVTESLVSRKAERAWVEAMACQTLLTEERNTWKLTGALLRDHLKADEFMEERGHNTMFVEASREGSDREIVEALMARDSFTRQAQLVVEWLESCAAHERGMGDDDDRLQYFAGGSSTWKNALHHVQSKNNIGCASSSHVTGINADAPSRQWLPMHEFHLFHSLFFHLRAGQVQRAKELAAKNGYRWLAAALEGCRPCHDPNNASTIGADFKQPTQGTFYRDLWMRACWRAASSPMCSRYKRAVYGALSGNLQAMLPACTTWEDQLWARMRAVVDLCVEQELRTAKQQDRSPGPLPPGYPNERGTFEAIFRDLQAAVGASGTRHQEITHILQRGVVLGDAASLVEEIHDWVTGQAIEPPLLTMRFLAHMSLLLRQVGRETGTEAFSALLHNYIHMLIDDGHVSLVDTYAAALKATDHVAKYTQLAQPPN